jgi:hypothetical protein
VWLYAPARGARAHAAELVEQRLRS